MEKKCVWWWRRNGQQQQLLLQKKRTKRVLTGVEYCKYVINTCWPVSWRCPVHENSLTQLLPVTGGNSVLLINRFATFRLVRVCACVCLWSLFCCVDVYILMDCLICWQLKRHFKSRSTAAASKNEYLTYQLFHIFVQRQWRFELFQVLSLVWKRLLRKLLRSHVCRKFNE